MPQDALNTNQALASLTISRDTYGPTLDTHLAPAAVEAVGVALGQRVQAHSPDRIAIWASADEAVLAHVVARESGTSMVRASEVEGQLFMQPEVRSGMRIAVLATVWQERRLQSMRALLDGRHVDVVCVAAVLNSPALADLVDLPTTFLATESDLGASA